MTTNLTNLLSWYLSEQIDISQLRHWVSLNIWQASEEERELIDQLAVELSYVDEGVSDELHFRVQIAELLLPTILEEVNETTEYSYNTVSNYSSSTEFKFRVETPGGVESLHLEGAFG